MTTMTTYRYADLDGLMSRMIGDEKHTSAATSTLDVVWTLYDRVLNIDPHRPDARERDRFVLSKGHGPMAFYAVLAAKGFFPAEWLDGWARFESPLGMHPDRTLIPGVEISAGSLGHGLPIAFGMALGIEARSEPSRVVCLMGDGELDEGSVHETIAVAGRRGMGRLQVVVIDNRSSATGWPGGIAARFDVEGWATATVDGRDHDAIEAALRTTGHRPLALIAEVEEQ